MELILFIPVLFVLQAAAQTGFNASSNGALQPSVLSADYHARHYQPQQAGQKEASSNIYDTIDRYIQEKSFESRDPDHYKINRRFIYHAPQNSVDHENQKVNNNGNGNLNNTNSYRP